MSTKAEIALETAFSFIQDVISKVHSTHGDEERAQMIRPEVLNLISLASRKIAEAEQLDPHAEFHYEDKIFTIPIAKSIALDAEGFIHCTAGDDKKGIPILEQAVKMHPENAMAWYHKAVAHGGQLEKKEALEAITKALEIDETNIEYHKAHEMIKSISGAEQAAMTATNLWPWRHLIFLGAIGGVAVAGQGHPVSEGIASTLGFIWLLTLVPFFFRMFGR